MTKPRRRRPRGWWLGLLVATPLMAAQGPRITLHAEQMSLRAVLGQLAPQLNRRFAGSVVESPTLAAKLYDFDLREATVAETLSTLTQTVGGSVQRTSRTTYNLEAYRQPLAYRLSQEVQGWTLGISWVRYYFYSLLYPGDPERDSPPYATLTPSYELTAPDDVESLRLLEAGPLGATTDAGESLAPRNAQTHVLAPGRADPRTWSLAVNLTAPTKPARKLTEAWVDLRFMPAVGEARYSFDLAAGAGQTATDHGYTAKLATTGDGAAYTVTISGPLPAADPLLKQVLQARDNWAEARLFAGDAPLPVDTRLSRTVLDAQTWTTEWLVSRLKQAWVGRGEPSTAPATRLELRFFQPALAGEPVRVSFADVPLPARSEGDVE